MICPHAASGCNYPEGECVGLCGDIRRIRIDSVRYGGLNHRTSIFAIRLTWEPRIWLGLGTDGGALMLGVAGLLLRISRAP